MAETIDSRNNQNGVPLVFLRERSIFGDRRPSKEEWLRHPELYEALGRVIEPSHITGLQRVNGMWRIYLDNLEDKVSLMSNGVPIRGKSIPVLMTNPNRPDNESSIKVRVKNIPLSVDDDTIVRSLILKGLEIISSFREKLRINGKLTNCETGDRIYFVKPNTLKTPLPGFMYFGKFKGKVVHFGQETTVARTPTCNKCLENGHRTDQCESDWKCKLCKKLGHKQSECDDQFDEETPSDTSITPTHTDVESDQGEPQQSQQTSDPTPAPPKPRARADQRSQSKPAETPRRPKPNNDSNTGQSKITQFVNPGSSGTLTPAKERHVKTSERSPPTPAEELHDNSKKSKPQK